MGGFRDSDTGCALVLVSRQNFLPDVYSVLCIMSNKTSSFLPSYLLFHPHPLHEIEMPGQLPPNSLVLRVLARQSFLPSPVYRTASTQPGLARPRPTVIPSISSVPPCLDTAWSCASSPDSHSFHLQCTTLPRHSLVLRVLARQSFLPSPVYRTASTQPGLARPRPTVIPAISSVPHCLDTAWSCASSPDSHSFHLQCTALPRHSLVLHVLARQSFLPSPVYHTASTQPGLARPRPTVIPSISSVPHCLDAAWSCASSPDSHSFHLQCTALPRHSRVLHVLARQSFLPSPVYRTASTQPGLARPRPTVIPSISSVPHCFDTSTQSRHHNHSSFHLNIIRNIVKLSAPIFIIFANTWKTFKFHHLNFHCSIGKSVIGSNIHDIEM